MFNIFKRKKENEVYSPVNGKCIPLEMVPDQMFANKLLGDGVAFSFEGNTVYAPCDGEIILIAQTNHAFGIRNKYGVEFLLHVGLDTVSLNGEGLEPLVKVGYKVKKNEPILRINRELMLEKGMNLTTPLVVTNLNGYKMEKNEIRDVDLNCVVIDLKKD